MTYYSEFDKKLIQNISLEKDTRPKLLGEILANKFYEFAKCAFFVTYNPHTYRILCSCTVNTSALQRKIVDVISIVSFLEKNGYVILIDSPKVWGRIILSGATTIIQDLAQIEPKESIKQDDSTIVNVYSINTSDGYNIAFEEINKSGHTHAISNPLVIIDNLNLKATNYSYNLRKKFSELINTYAYPTTKLRNLVINNFKSEEDIYNEKVLRKANIQISLNRLTLIIAFLTLLITFIGVLAPTIDITIIPCINPNVILPQIIKDILSCS